MRTNYKKMLPLILVPAMAACNGNETVGDFCFDEMSYSPTETVFRMFAPANASCAVLIGKDSVPMTKQAVVAGSPEGAVWTATVKGNRKGEEYQFVVDGKYSPGVFAKAVTTNGKKGVVADMGDTNPDGWESDQHVLRSPQDMVIYELHHRDFSIANKEATHPGKFLALTEPWAIGHLKELGVNAVHMLPSYDFGSIDESQPDSAQYNWGYDPVNYNVPEGSYATNATDPLCRIREFKQMVMALHKAGISVILDVVYNHTFDIEHSNFQNTFPDYYYRKKASADGKAEYSNGSGCGNETASEKPMMRRFMTESVKYWISEYHIDGFRFDLMGCHDIETMNTIRAAVDSLCPGIFIYGEGWSAGECALPAESLGIKANTSKMPGIAAFCDDMRDALRGPFSDDSKGAFLIGLPVEQMSIMAGIAGMTDHPQVDYAKVNYSDKPYAKEPTQMISYVSCHDDMCLTDRLRSSLSSDEGKRLRKTGSGNMDDEVIRLDLLAQTAVMTSQGVPFMLCGEELLRTKQGVHNSYNSPDSINRLDWTNKERYPQVFAYYKNLIALRSHHPAFRLGKAELVRKHLSFITSTQPQDSKRPLVAFRIKDAPNDKWADIIVVLNAGRNEEKLLIPDGTYTVVCRDGHIDENGMGQISGGEVSVPRQSALIMYKN